MFLISLNISQQVVRMPVLGDSRAGPCQEEVAATCPSRGLGLPFPTELLPGSILAVFAVPEMHSQRLSSCSTCKVLQKGKICIILF